MHGRGGCLLCWGGWKGLTFLGQGWGRCCPCLPEPQSSQALDLPPSPGPVLSTLSPSPCSAHLSQLILVCIISSAHPHPPAASLLPLHPALTRGPHLIAMGEGAPDWGWVSTHPASSPIPAGPGRGQITSRFLSLDFPPRQNKVFVGMKSEQARVMMVLIIAAIYRVPARC